MNNIPKPALFLGLAGLIPFIASAALILSNSLFSFEFVELPNGARLMAWRVMIIYGLIICGFMSGVQWGFVVKLEEWHYYLLSVIVPIALFLSLMLLSDDNIRGALVALIAGFMGVFAIDIYLQRQSIAPVWWLSLRAPLTVTVILCLAIGLF